MNTNGETVGRHRQLAACLLLAGCFDSTSYRGECGGAPACPSLPSSDGANAPSSGRDDGRGRWQPHEAAGTYRPVLDPRVGEQQVPEIEPADAGTPSPPTAPSSGARVIAYVDCSCGFGVGSLEGRCLADPDPSVNHVKSWEERGTSPISHYVLSFLSFRGADIQTAPDPFGVWAGGGGRIGDFALEAHVREAMLAARAAGKKIILSIGGDAGSSGLLSWWTANGASSTDRVDGMRAKLEAVASMFEAQNQGLAVDGFDAAIALGGVYGYGSDKYAATRDLIDAVPDRFSATLVVQVGNGLCAAPVVGDPLNPVETMGGQCQQPTNGDDAPWVLARRDRDCTRSDGRPRLDYFGIQYYNAGSAACCGGGDDPASMVTSAVQNYKNLANGWPSSGDTQDPTNPWHQWTWYPGPWAAFTGIGAERLVLGKPGCRGCAASNYLDPARMREMISRLDHQLTGPMGGILFWDLCRLFAGAGPQCAGGECQPSWGGPSLLGDLTDLKQRMDGLVLR